MKCHVKGCKEDALRRCGWKYCEEHGRWATTTIRAFVRAEIARLAKPGEGPSDTLARLLKLEKPR